MFKEYLLKYIYYNIKSIIDKYSVIRKIKGNAICDADDNLLEIDIMMKCRKMVIFRFTTYFELTVYLIKTNGKVIIKKKNWVHGWICNEYYRELDLGNPDLMECVDKCIIELVEIEWEKYVENLKIGCIILFAVSIVAAIVRYLMLIGD